MYPSRNSSTGGGNNGIYKNPTFPNQNQNQNGKPVPVKIPEKSGKKSTTTTTTTATTTTGLDDNLLMASQKIWMADPAQGFILGNIIDLGSERLTVDPMGLSRGRKVEAMQMAYDSVYPAEDNSDQDYDDNCSLMYLNEATLLNNIRLRYGRQQIYTYIANMLIAVNPYVEIKGLYSTDTMKRYQGKSLGTLPPHVYAIGDKSFRDMKVTKQSQSIIVSGESGAGKTESTKYILQYLCGTWGSVPAKESQLAAGPIEQKILDANPVLESFGNAKTTRNNNSSRFGKFIEIHFENISKVTGGFISHYLLEKSRICSQSPEERNYHIFYQILCGAPNQLKQNLGLANLGLNDFHYLRNGCQKFFGREGGKLYDPIVDDIEDFRCMEKAMERLGLEESDRLSIYTVVAAVLHLGNVAFEDDPEDKRGGCRVTEKSESALKISSGLIGVDVDELRVALTSRVMQTAKGGVKGTVIMVPLKVHEASSARDALAKAMYSRLFDAIVHSINRSIPFKSSTTTYIGVLDIAGFEFFTVNSFEQFCINYCNEKLQQFFNERVLHDEQTLYEKEGLGLDKIEYVDNTDCIDLIESPKMGILSILDEESKLPKPSSAHFASEVHKAFPNHFRLALPRKSKIREHREIRDEEGFLVRHFAGAVCYKTTLFIEKNNDALHASLEALVQGAMNPYLQGLFKESRAQVGKLSYISVASKFRSQLCELLEKLRGTGTSFIRCLKPNAKMIAQEFEGGQILSQLQSAGMTSVLELMQKGYPSRVHFANLYSSYKSFLPSKLSSLDPRFFCRALFKALGLNEEDFRFGLTRIFFRPGKFKEFDQLMRSDPTSLAQMISAVSRWIVQSKWKKAQFVALSVIKLKNKILYRRKYSIVMQSTVRGYLARKKHRPRYLGTLNLKKLSHQIESMGSTVSKLKKDRESSKRDVDQLHVDLNAAIRLIKTNPKMTEKEIEKLTQGLLGQCDTLIKTLSKRVENEKLAEEQEKARKAREEMDRQKKEKEEKEKLQQLEIENKKKKLEMEERRKREEAEMKKMAGKNEKNLNLGSNLNLAQEQQDKRDVELAMRLAQEAGVTLDLNGGQLKRSNFIVSSRTGKKYELSGWKYSDLRDTINTSCDLELLEACREEFHRRLKVYHAWKAKNRATKQEGEMDERAPKSIYQHQASTYGSSSSSSGGAPSPIPPAGAPTSRFFRVPFMKDGQNRGMWFAHFEGQYISRQMELYPGKEPVLLLAGTDSMQMCELKLKETGLAKRRGAEILEHEFEKEWTKNGGNSNGNN